MKKNTEITQKVHSKLGASSAHRWLECPASIKMSVGIERSTSIDAVNGTAAHELAEKCLKENLSPYDFIGKTVYTDATFGEIEADEEMADAVQMYIDVIKADLKPSSRLIVEHPFQLKNLDADFFGTNDACILDTFKITVYDFKYGRGHEVEAENNPQLMYYGIGAEDLAELYEEIELVIVQPRLYSNQVKRWTTTFDELNKFKKVLTDGALATRAENPLLKAGEHCFFCPAKGKCQEAKRHSMGQITDTFKKLDKATGVPIEFPEPKELSLEQISRILNHAEDIKSFIDAVRGHAQNLAMDGTNIEGHKLVLSQTRRKLISDEEEIINDLGAFGLAEDKIFVRKIKGIGDLTSALREAANIKKAEADKIIDRLTTKPEPNLILVPEKDKRQAQKPSLIKESLFKKIS